jgi:predicted nucleic acid-binding protein
MYIDIDTLRSYFIEDDNTEVVKEILEKEKLITSVITIEQLIFDCEKNKKKMDIKQLEKFKRLQIVPLTKEIVKLAMKFMEKYKLTFHQAIHMATCINHKEKMLSFNKKWDEIKEVERVDPLSIISIKAKLNKGSVPFINWL